MIPEGVPTTKTQTKIHFGLGFLFLPILKSILLEWEEIKNPKLTFRVFVAEKEGLNIFKCSFF